MFTKIVSLIVSHSCRPTLVKNDRQLRKMNKHNLSGPKRTILSQFRKKFQKISEFCGGNGPSKRFPTFGGLILVQQAKPFNLSHSTSDKCFLDISAFSENPWLSTVIPTPNDLTTRTFVKLSKP